MLKVFTEIFFVLGVLFVFELLLHFLTSDVCKFTRFTRVLLAPTTVISDKFWRGRRKWQVTLTFGIVLFVGVMAAAVIGRGEVMDGAVDNIPVINSVMLFFKYEAKVPLEEFAYCGFAGILAILITDCLAGLIVGEGDKKNSRAFIIGYAPLLVITSILSGSVIKATGLKDIVHGLLNGTGGAASFGRFLCIYFLVLFIIGYAKEIFVFAGIVGISGSLFEVYYNSSARITDEFMGNLMLHLLGYDNWNDVMNSAQAVVPTWFKLLVCMIVILLAAAFEYLLDALFAKVFEKPSANR